MSFPFYIARRYLFSKKSTNAINVISAISVIGVAVATMAMVIVLSVFNGFQDLVASFFTNIDPQLKVVPVMGKTAPADDPILTKIKANAHVAVATECVEDQALAIYHGRQSMVTVMGVEDNFRQLTDFDQVLRGDGDFMLHAANLQYGILGVRLAQNLDMGYDWDGFLSLYAPMREGQYDPMVSPGFVVDSVMSPGVLFNVMQGRYDKGYIIVSIEMARNLFGQQGRLSSLELRLKPGCNVGSAKKQLAQLAQGRYKVLDRYEQQADTFKIMNIEKLMAYLFLTFILVVACFNIISSLLMLDLSFRRSPHQFDGCLAWHRHRPFALRAAATVRACLAGRKCRHLHCRCLSRECALYRRAVHLPHGHCRRLVIVVVPREVHEQAPVVRSVVVSDRFHNANRVRSEDVSVSSLLTLIYSSI